MIRFPTKWKPYKFQVPLWNYLAEGGKKAVAVWHRRAGKDLLGLHWITAAALREVGTYWYVYPTYAQARLSVWDGTTLDGESYMSFLPEEMIVEASQTKGRIVFTNGSIIQFVGSDRYDKLRGGGIKGAVISEYSYHNPKAVGSVIEPMLLRSGGWILYLYTPSDDPEKTHGHTLFKAALKDKEAYCEKKTIKETFDHDGKALVCDKTVRKSTMSLEQIEREFFCDFEAAKFTKEKSREKNMFTPDLNIAKTSGRIGYFPFDPAYPVDTYWDVGIVDFTTIWFCQERKDDVVVIDFYYNNNKPIEFYLNVLRSRGGYRYGRNVLPHDMNRREPVTLDTRLLKANEIAEKLCFPPFVVGGKYRKEEMLEEAREFLSKCKMDSKRCHEGLQALFDFDVTKVSLRKGGHSSFQSDVVSAFCYMAMNVKTKQERRAETQMIEEDYSRFSEAINDYNPLEF